MRCTVRGREVQVRARVGDMGEPCGWLLEEVQRDVARAQGQVQAPNEELESNGAEFARAQMACMGSCIQVG